MDLHSFKNRLEKYDLVIFAELGYILLSILKNGEIARFPVEKYNILKSENLFSSCLYNYTRNTPSVIFRGFFLFLSTGSFIQIIYVIPLITTLN